MNIRTPAVLVATVLALGGVAASPALAQPPSGDVAQCVRGTWQSTGVTFARQGANDMTVNGGSGASLTIGDTGSTTLDFARMHQANFSSTKHNIQVQGFVELSGQATGTVTTTENSGSTGTISAHDVNWGNVQLTVSLSQPISSTPVDHVPVTQLQQLAPQLAQQHGHNGMHRPTLTQATYTCGNGTLTLASTLQTQQHNNLANITWTFERPTG